MVDANVTTVAVSLIQIDLETVLVDHDSSSHRLIKPVALYVDHCRSIRIFSYTILFRSHMTAPNFDGVTIFRIPCVSNLRWTVLHLYFFSELVERLSGVSISISAIDLTNGIVWLACSMIEKHVDPAPTVRSQHFTKIFKTNLSIRIEFVLGHKCLFELCLSSGSASPEMGSREGLVFNSDHQNVCKIYLPDSYETRFASGLGEDVVFSIRKITWKRA